MNDLKQHSIDINSFTTFPSIKVEYIEELKSPNYPEHKASAEYVSDQIDVLKWWHSHERNGRRHLMKYIKFKRDQKSENNYY